MPQGLPAHRPTAYPARPEAHTKATGHVPQHPQARAQENAPAQRGHVSQRGTAPPEPQQHPNNWRQQNQDRRAASATTNAPAASSRQFHDSPQLAILREPSFRRPAPQARRIRQGGPSPGGRAKPITLRDKRPAYGSNSWLPVTN